MQFTISSVFQSNMVIQRDKKTTFSGNAEAFRNVYIKFNNLIERSIVNDDNKWEIEFDSFSASTTPNKLEAGYIFNGKLDKKIELDNILIGDVWFGSGQSNMEMGIELTTKDNVCKLLTENSNFRFLLWEKRSATSPIEEINSKWMIATPENVKMNGWGGLSSLGYHMALFLNRNSDIPIGFIQSAYGGSKIIPWIKPDFLISENFLKGYFNEWFMAEEQFKKNPSKAHPFSTYTEYNNLKPASLYNAMIHPFSPINVKGVIWYQGESDVDLYENYSIKLSLLFESFKENFSDLELELIIVEIAYYKHYRKNSLKNFREQQRIASNMIPNSKLISTKGLGDEDDIHPHYKREIGERIAQYILSNMI